MAFSVAAWVKLGRVGARAHSPILGKQRDEQRGFLLMAEEDDRRVAASDSAVGLPSANRTAFEIGCYRWSTKYQRFLAGFSDDVRVHNGALDDHEIQALGCQ